MLRAEYLPICHVVNSGCAITMQADRLGWSNTDCVYERDDSQSGRDHDAAGVGSKKKRDRDERDPDASSNKKHKRTLPRVLEVGSGCGLLGLVIAHLGAEVVLTEAAEAMDLLSDNVSKVVSPPRVSDSSRLSLSRSAYAHLALWPADAPQRCPNRAQLT